MSRIPSTKKTKYNNNDPFRWVDSQWEKFMKEQKEMKNHIKQLQDDLVTCNEHFQKQRKQMEDLVSRVPSTYLTDSAKFGGETHPDAKHKSWDEIMPHKEWVDSWVKHNDKNDEHNKTYVYESPDKGKTVYRRELGDYDTPREQVDKDGIPLPTQMDLFE